MLTQYNLVPTLDWYLSIVRGCKGKSIELLQLSIVPLHQALEKSAADPFLFFPFRMLLWAHPVLDRRFILTVDE